jgi:hypothetical protein
VTVKTHWRIKHACGHIADHDLSDRRVDERAGFARWLATKDCSDCWRARRADAEQRAKEQWLADKRAAEAAETELWEHQHGMPSLTGSPRSIVWAQRCRRSIMEGAYLYLVLGGDMTHADWADRFEPAARSITAGSWWIDNRDTEPWDVAELLDAVSLTSHPSGSEPSSRGDDPK